MPRRMTLAGISSDDLKVIRPPHPHSLSTYSPPVAGPLGSLPPVALPIYYRVPRLLWRQECFSLPGNLDANRRQWKGLVNRTNIHLLSLQNIGAKAETNAKSGERILSASEAYSELHRRRKSKRIVRKRYFFVGLWLESMSLRSATTRASSPVNCTPARSTTIQSSRASCEEMTSVTRSTTPSGTYTSRFLKTGKETTKTLRWYYECHFYEQHRLSLGRA